MRESFLPYAKPDISPAEVDAVVQVLRSGWLSSGPQVAEFEAAARSYLGCGHAVAVSSCTAAIHLLLEACGVGAGDEVITPSFTWTAAPNMIHQVGARPVFADIDRDSRMLSAESVDAAVTSRTKAVLPVHFAGQPADLDALGELCRKRGLILIEDAAHAIGAEYRGERIGSGPHPAVFSFHAVKNLAAGEGGLVAVPDANTAERVRALRFHGLTKDAWQRHSSETSRYDLAAPGWKYHWSDLHAAIATVQLRRLETFLQARRRLAGRYGAALKDVPGIRCPAPVPYPARHAWHLYAIEIDPEITGIDRDAFRAALRERNIGTGLHYAAVHQLDFYRRTYPPTVSLANTEAVAERIVSLPLFTEMSPRDARDVVAAIHEVIDVTRAP